MSFFWFSSQMFQAGPSEEFTQLLSNPGATLDQILAMDEAVTQAKRHCEPLLAL
jgi:hypothetical protein